MRARGGCDIRDVNLNSENWAMVKAALVAGMYPNMVNFNKESSLKKLHFHPTSVLSQFQFKEVGDAHAHTRTHTVLCMHAVSFMGIWGMT